MVATERTAYPRFGSTPSRSQLARLYTPTFREIELARRNTHGEEQSLTYLLMLKSFRSLGYFPALEEVPEAVVSHVRSWLKLGGEIVAAPPARSRQRYRDSIREYLRVKAYGDEGGRMTIEAVAEVALTMDEPADLVNVAIEELIKERVKLPAFSTLDRLTRHTRYSVNYRLFLRVNERITAAMKRPPNLVAYQRRRRWSAHASHTLRRGFFGITPGHDSLPVVLAFPVRRGCLRQNPDQYLRSREHRVMAGR